MKDPEATNEQVHVLINGDYFGPYSIEDFQQYLREEKILPGDMIWTESLKSWQSVKRFLDRSKHPPQMLPSAPAGDDANSAEALYAEALSRSLGDDGYFKDHNEAYRCFLKAAELGYTEAQIEVAREYRQNLYSVFPQDETRVLHWFQRAASNGGPEARKHLDDYMQERAKERDLVNEFVETCKAASGGELEATLTLGMCYFHGRGVYRDSTEAVRLFRIAAESGHVEAQYSLAMRLHYGDGVDINLDEAMHWYRSAGQKGHLPAQSELGALLLSSRGESETILLEAAQWCRIAADQGDQVAQFNLAGCYYNGRGVVKDFFEARRLWAILAEKGNADAQNQLGIMSTRGEGCAEDPSEAVVWFRKAAEKFNADAAFNLAVQFAKGNGVARDLTEASRFYRIAAEQGVKEALRQLEIWAEAGLPSAQLNLGLLYKVDEFDLDILGTHPVNRDHPRFLKLLRKAADCGEPEAQFILGVEYMQGSLDKSKLPHNPAAAIKWFSRSAQQGHAPAQRQLGDVLKREGNYIEAYKWLALAVERGEDLAVDMSELAAQMDEGEIKEAQTAVADFQPESEQSAQHHNAFGRLLHDQCRVR